MKLTPQAAPTTPFTGPKTGGEPSARDRALAAYNDPAKVAKAAGAFGITPGATNPTGQLPGRMNDQAAFGLPVQNANAVSPEELSAIQAPRQNTEVREESQAAAEEVVTPPAEDPSAKRLNELVQREKMARIKARQIQQQQMALKSQEDALKAREAAIQAESAKYSQGYISQDRLKTDPLSVLAEAGLSYDEIAQQLINQQPRDPRIEAMMSRQEAKIKELESKLDSQQKGYQDNQKQAYDQAVKQIASDVKNLVKTDPTFEAIKATNSEADVVDLITQTYEKDGVLLSVEEASLEVENYLVEEATKLTKLQKIRQRLQAEATKPVSQASTKQGVQQQKQPMRTLTNAGASSRPMTAKERAIAAFKGELK